MLIAEEILIEIIQGTQSVIIPHDADDDDNDDDGDADDGDADDGDDDGGDDDDGDVDVDGGIGGAITTILSASSSSAVHVSTLTAAVASSSIVCSSISYSCNTCYCGMPSIDC